MIKFFKILALLEGVSMLLLLFVAMPMKYMFGDPFLVKHVGMAHGVLFVAYIIVATMLKFEDSWSWKKYAYICIASAVPFGTLSMESNYSPRPS